ncbi:MAG TPA: thioredoxin domain-containing protein [Pyrinomonadaceae bacterium]
MKRILPFIIILVVLGAALGSAWYFTRPNPATPTVTQPAPPPSPGSQSTPAQQPVARQGVPGAEPAHSIGPANAPIHLEEFGDFECPPCGMLHPILEQMHEEFGERLRITFREFPLANHQHARTAAAAAEAAGIQGKFWPMHDLIYERQNVWKTQFNTRAIFEDYAREIGLDVERYNRDMDGNLVTQRIFQDSRRGQSLGVQGTPTVFMNGREVPFENLAPDKLRLVIMKELQAVGSK